MSAAKQGNLLTTPRADSKYVTGARVELLSSGSMAAVIPSPCPKPQPLQPISI
jgi:hypothetical protein